MDLVLEMCPDVVPEERCAVQGRILSYQDPNGATRWSTALPGEPHGVPYWDRTGEDGRVYVGVYGTRGSSLVALDRKDGTILWDSPGGNNYPSPTGEGLVMAVKTGSQRGDKWVAVARRARDGNVVWTLDLPGDASPYFSTLGRGWILVATWWEDPPLRVSYVVNSDGNVLWRLDREYIAAARWEGKDILFSSDRRLCRMDPNGSVKWEVAYPQEDSVYFWRRPEIVDIDGEDSVVLFHDHYCIEVWRVSRLEGQVRWKTTWEIPGWNWRVRRRVEKVALRGDEIIVASRASKLSGVRLSAASGRQLETCEANIPPRR